MGAFSLVSGIIEPTNITNSAPAANPSTRAHEPAPTRREMTYQPIEASAHTMATIIQPRTIVRDSLPADFISAAEPTASGKFDTKIGEQRNAHALTTGKAFKLTFSHADLLDSGDPTVNNLRQF
jgi:hypothetical protein